MLPTLVTGNFGGGNGDVDVLVPFLAPVITLTMQLWWSDIQLFEVEFEKKLWWTVLTD